MGGPTEDTGSRTPSELEDWIAQGAEALDVPLTTEAVARLAELTERIQHWNTRIRIIGPCSLSEAVDRHIHDGLALLRLLDQPAVQALGVNWVDIGAGAGLPSLVLAAARPDLRLLLVEPIAKKIAFAKEAAWAMKLEGVTIQTGRLEALPTAGPERPRAAMSRAVFAPDIWLERGRALVGPEGSVLVMMGRGAPKALVSGATWVDRTVLPISNADRVNVIWGPQSDPAAP